MELSKEKWRALLAPTLVKLLGDSKYFMGNEISAVDFLVAKPLNNAQSMGMLEDFPALFALYERISSMPSFAVAYGQPKRSSFTENRGLVLTPSPPTTT